MRCLSTGLGWLRVAWVLCAALFLISASAFSISAFANCALAGPEHQHPTPTSNIQSACSAGNGYSKFDVGCWMFRSFADTVTRSQSLSRSHMSFFRHTIAEYTCTKHCGITAPSLARTCRFHLLAAAVAQFRCGCFRFTRSFLGITSSVSRRRTNSSIHGGFLTSFLLMPLFTAGTTLCKNAVRQCSSPVSISTLRARIDLIGATS